MASATSVVAACVLAGLAVAACGGDDADETEPADETPTSSTESTAGYDAPGGKVIFDLRVKPSDRHAAVEAYADWQRASTTALREREMSGAVTNNAAKGPAQVVEDSLEKVRQEDYIVPRRMIGRVDSVRARARAAIVRACLWSPSFDYRDRESDAAATKAKPRWIGVEVRMTRSTGQDDQWIVAGLSSRADCKGARP